MKKITIAIDGHSSCGKSTLAKDLAKKLNYIFIDSGAMYRAVTLLALREKLISNQNINETELQKRINTISIDFKYNNQTSKSETFLNGENVESEIRGIEVASYVSPISKIGFVRTKLVELQQKMGEQGGIIMDGRDIGTVVFPKAELKLFVTASPEVRAKRRYNELIAKGDNVSYDEIKQNLLSRDTMDSNREIAPLKKADDAIELDNSNMTIEEQFNWTIKLLNEKFGLC